MEVQSVFWIILILLLIYIIYIYVTKDKTMLNQAVTAGNVMTTLSPSSIASAEDFGSSNFTYSLWFYIEDWNYRYGEVKDLISRSITYPAMGTQEGMNSLGGAMDEISEKQPCPFVMLSPKENNLVIALTCYTQDSTADAGVVHYVEVVNVPIQKWVNLYFSVYGRTIDIYINGKLVRTGILPGPAKIAPASNIYLTPNGGFKGWTSKFQYWNTASNPQAAWDTYIKGYGGGLLENLFGKYKVKMSLLVDNKEEAQFTV